MNKKKRAIRNFIRILCILLAFIASTGILSNISMFFNHKEATDVGKNVLNILIVPFSMGLLFSIIATLIFSGLLVRTNEDASYRNIFITLLIFFVLAVGSVIAIGVYAGEDLINTNSSFETTMSNLIWVFAIPVIPTLIFMIRKNKKINKSNNDKEDTSFTGEEENSLQDF